MKGMRPPSKILPNLLAFIMPLNKTIGVAPRDEIPPQTWILIGCFGLCFSFLGCKRFLKHNLECCSNCTEHSSVKITSLKFSFHFNCSLHQLSLFRLLSYIHERNEEHETIHLYQDCTIIIGWLQ